MKFMEVVRMASVTVGKSRALLVVTMIFVAAWWLLSPEALASIVDYFRGGGGLDLLTP